MGSGQSVEQALSASCVELAVLQEIRRGLLFFDCSQKIDLLSMIRMQEGTEI
jgi:hypothetical protein